MNVSGKAGSKYLGILYPKYPRNWLTLFITTYIITLFTSTKLCSTAGKRLFSGDDKVSDDARSTKLLKSIHSVAWIWLISCLLANYPFIWTMKKLMQIALKKIKTSFPDIYYDQHGRVIPSMTGQCYD
ncbi:unnamed protein product [Clavelina lepadiformis]|uniref:Uncharacterized protein n=1 Tax=Clavelina lepadiformis TaxID=159417 RepID=A0ABP0FGV3_CLALP